MKPRRKEGNFLSQGGGGLGTPREWEGRREGGKLLMLFSFSFFFNRLGLSSLSLKSRWVSSGGGCGFPGWFSVGHRVKSLIQQLPVPVYDSLNSLSPPQITIARCSSIVIHIYRG